MLGKELLLRGAMPIDGVIGPVYDYHGFKLQRHISNEATVITYKAADGTTKRMAVKDAKFRSVQIFGTYNTNISGVPDIINLNLGSTIMYIGGEYRVPHDKPMPESVTNNLIFQTWGSKMKITKSAREICDIWMTYNDKTDSASIKGVPAVAWCCSQTLIGRPCAMAKAYEILVIFACSDKLDDMDPSAVAYPTLKLGYTATGSTKYGRCQAYNGKVAELIFSCIESGANDVRRVTYEGNCVGASVYKKANGTAVPILELD